MAKMPLTLRPRARDFVRTQIHSRNAPEQFYQDPNPLCGSRGRTLEDAVQPAQWPVEDAHSLTGPESYTEPNPPLLVRTGTYCGHRFIRNRSRAPGIAQNTVYARGPTNARQVSIRFAEPGEEVAGEQRSGSAFPPTWTSLDNQWKKSLSAEVADAIQNEGLLAWLCLNHEPVKADRGRLSHSRFPFGPLL